MSGPLNAFPSYRACQKGMAPENNSACKVRPTSPDRGWVNNLSEIWSHKSEEMVIEQYLGEVLRTYQGTPGLIWYLETGHLNDILSKVPTGLASHIEMSRIPFFPEQSRLSCGLTDAKSRGSRAGLGLSKSWAEPKALQSLMSGLGSAQAFRAQLPGL